MNPYDEELVAKLQRKYQDGGSLDGDLSDTIKDMISVLRTYPPISLAIAVDHLQLVQAAFSVTGRYDEAAIVESACALLELAHAGKIVPKE